MTHPTLPSDVSGQPFKAPNLLTNPGAEGSGMSGTAATLEVVQSMGHRHFFRACGMATSWSLEKMPVPWSNHNVTMVFSPGMKQQCVPQPAQRRSLNHSRVVEALEWWRTTTVVTPRYNHHLFKFRILVIVIGYDSACRCWAQVHISQAT